MTDARDHVADPLRDRVAKVVESYGFELFDLQFRRESIGWVLRVMIDRPWRVGMPPESGDRVVAAETGVTVDDCSRISHDLSAILDVEPELLGDPDRTYTLEVSSPGLDRPLRDERDYLRFTGRLAKIVATPVDGQASFSGRLAGVEDGHVLIQEGKRTHRVPLAAIRRAKLDIEF